jgi:putative two-component system response regulator
MAALQGSRQRGRPPDDSGFAMPRIIMDDGLACCAPRSPDPFMPRSVECHDDPEQALARVQAVEFDLVIVDYLMPKLHGVGFMRRLDALHSHAARLLLSGHARVLERIEAVRGLGPIEIMPKPWDDEKLCLAISRLVQTRQHQLSPSRPPPYARPPLPNRRQPVF